MFLVTYNAQFYENNYACSIYRFAINTLKFMKHITISECLKKK